MYLTVSNFISQKVEGAIRGGSNLALRLTNKEDLVGKAEMMGTFGENENVT